MGVAEDHPHWGITITRPRAKVLLPLAQPISNLTTKEVSPAHLFDLNHHEGKGQKMQPQIPPFQMINQSSISAQMQHNAGLYHQ